MERIRTIKPEFQQSESMGRVSRDARLLFIQLWTFADDVGRARAASRMLASALFPYDDDAPHLMDVWLSELEREQCIRRYVVDGATYLEIVNWRYWQPKWRQRVLDVSRSEWRRLRRLVLQMDHATCVYCGSKERIECDHIIPRAKGGETTEDNLVAACHACNRSKKDMLVEEWRP